jgi:serine/threonine protein kinase
MLGRVTWWAAYLASQRMHSPIFSLVAKTPRDRDKNDQTLMRKTPEFSGRVHRFAYAEVRSQTRMLQPIFDLLIIIIQYLLSGSLKGVNVMYRRSPKLLIFMCSYLTSSVENAMLWANGSTPIELLAKEIDDALCYNSDGQEFLPEDKIRYFTQEEKILSVIGDAKLFGSMAELITFISNEAPRLFLILVLMESEPLEERLKDFRNENFVDSVLPIKLDQNYLATTLRVQEPVNLTRYSVFTQWGRERRRSFTSSQWFFTAPVFGTSKFHLQLAAAQRLPFLDVAPRPASSGYFGEVTKVIIHAKHVDPSAKLSVFPWSPRSSGKDKIPLPIEAIAVAVKKTKEGDDDPKFSRAAFFDKEVRNLDILRNYRSPHLIKPIAGYQIGQNRCLMFPWADGGNLGRYWEEHPSRARDRTHVLWQLHQFVEICGALEELHGSNCRHGDLKPENILWFDPEDKQGGTLQIADLGLATFHVKEANTRDRKGMPTQTPSGTSRYEPPEMDAQRNTDEARSRQYDIWSLGCVVFELLLWLAYGPSDITIFRDNTPYFWQRGNKREHARYIVHEYAVAIMESLDTQFKAHSAYKDLLDLVRYRLLVVKYSEDYNLVADDCRASAAKVHQCFEGIYQSCARNEKDYLTPLEERLQYPKIELHSQATQRNGAQHNEVHEKDGKLAVPGQNPITKSTVETKQTPEETSIPELEESLTHEASDDRTSELPVEFRFNLRQPTFPQHLGNQNSQASQASNHQEVCLS